MGSSAIVRVLQVRNFASRPIHGPKVPNVFKSPRYEQISSIMIDLLSEMGLVLILNIIIYVNYFWELIREKRTRWTDSTGLN